MKEKIKSELKNFWHFGIRLNQGLAFHVVGGKGFYWLFESMSMVIFIAVVWEVFEVCASLYKYGSWSNAMADTKYKTTKNWLYDSLGDILGAVVGAL